MEASCSPLQAPGPAGTEEGLGDTQSAGCKLEGKEERGGLAACSVEELLGRAQPRAVVECTSDGFGCMAWVVLNLV